MYSFRRIFGFAALALGLLLLHGGSAIAQNRAIKGKVTDDKGQPIAGAQITLMGLDVSRTFTVKSDKRGEYIYLLGLQAATYRVVARAKGFKPEFKDQLRPQLSEQLVADFQLTPGEDYKLPFEMTDAEKADYAKRLADQEKKRKVNDEIKVDFAQAVQLSESGKYAEAIDLFKKTLERSPDESAIYAGIAKAYEKLGKNDEAVTFYEKAIGLSPNDAALYSNMGVTLSTMGKVAESEAAFKKAASIDPVGAGQTFYNLGATLVNNGQTEKAAEAFKQSIAADPNFAESYYQLGISLSGKPDTMPAAIEALKKYIEIGKKPDQVDVAKELMKALGGK